MEFLIPLKDILIGPGKRFDPSTGSEEGVIALIKKTYGFLAETMEVSIHEGMVRIKFKEDTPGKINEALAKLEKAVKEAQLGRLQKALNLFQEVLAVIPEHVDARRNLAKTYLELGNMDKAKKHLNEKEFQEVVGKTLLKQVYEQIRKENQEQPGSSKA